MNRRIISTNAGYLRKAEDGWLYTSVRSEADLYSPKEITAIKEQFLIGIEFTELEPTKDEWYKWRARRAGSTKSLARSLASRLNGMKHKRSKR